MKVTVLVYFFYIKFNLVLFDFIWFSYTVFYLFDLVLFELIWLCFYLIWISFTWGCFIWIYLISIIRYFFSFIWSPFSLILSHWMSWTGSRAHILFYLAELFHLHLIVLWFYSFIVLFKKVINWKVWMKGIKEWKETLIKRWELPD